MDTIFYIVYTSIYLILLFIGIGLANKHGWADPANVLLAVLVGLIYDNSILAVGRYVGEGELLESLNLARYLLHAFLTPLLVIFAWSTLKKADCKWAEWTITKVAFFLLTFALIGIELVGEVADISLEANWDYGVLSYQNTAASDGPPIMILGVTTVLLLTSFIIWRKQGWSFFLIGTLLMITGSTVTIPFPTNALTNLFELILLVSLLATKAFQDNKIH
ncbi:hypothetical protein [Sediminibacillus massiliensis]|uniref:hypothetical protein n=1 Tax=Sediminibacillus massiliensis TaxID=1926277 RepID=UPI0009887FEB|nr:hypothetical protein [Sediminibacillus massiliensis]